jgi:hypothetical protein
VNDLLIGLLGGVLGALLIAGLAAWFAWRVLKQMQAPGLPVVPTAPPDAPSPYSTLDSAPERKSAAVRLAQASAGPRCDGCAHFDVAAGQAAMRENPAFVAACASIPPWRMDRVIKTEPNPDHVLLVTEIDLARERGDAEQVLSLESQLELTPATRPLPDDKQEVDPELMKVSWEDFGACLVRSEVRAPHDACDDWTSA